MRKAIPNQEKYGMKPFSINCEKSKVYGFNIYDMLDTTNYIGYNKGNFKMISNHLYHIYSWEYSYSTSNLMYVDEEGKITFFEAVNCLNRGANLKDVEEFINKIIIDKDKRNELLNILPFYKDFGVYMGHCGNDEIWNCEQN